MNHTLKTLRVKVSTMFGHYISSKLIKKSIREDSMLQDKLKNNLFYGEIILADDVDLVDVDMSKIAFTVRKLYWYKKELRALIDVIDTPRGRILFNNTNRCKFFTYASTDKVKSYTLHKIVAI